MYIERQKTSSTCGYNNVQLASYFTLSYSNQSPEKTLKKQFVPYKTIRSCNTEKTRCTILRRSFLVYDNSTVHTKDKTPSLLSVSIQRGERKKENPTTLASSSGRSYVAAYIVDNPHTRWKIGSVDINIASYRCCQA